MSFARTRNSPKSRSSFVGAFKRRFGRNHHRSGPSSDEEDLLVWDVPNPFAPPDPDLAYVRALVDAEIARMRRFESIGPLDPVDDTDTDTDTEDSNDGADDADDEDEDDYDDKEDTPAPIVLPRLLPVPLRFIHSPPPSPPPPSPSPSPSPPSPADPCHAWADLAKVYNDIQAEERARKAKRDAHRSRAKALAILGPEASVAL